MHLILICWFMPIMLIRPCTRRHISFWRWSLTGGDKAGNAVVCIPSQALLEFLNTITWSRLESPLAMRDAVAVVQYYVDSGIPIIYPKHSQLHTVLALLESVTSRKNIFDAGLAATLHDNNIAGLYTVNTKDFKHFDFLDVVNPLEG